MAFIKKVEKGEKCPFWDFLEQFDQSAVSAFKNFIELVAKNRYHETIPFDWRGGGIFEKERRPPPLP